MSESSSLLDEAVLNELRELSRELEQDVLGEVVTAYRKVAPELLVALEEAVGGRVFDALARAAHTLKGSSAQIGASVVRDLAREIEAEARAERGDRIAPLVAQCRVAYVAVDEALARVVGEKS
ncbi:MAG: Hpt domain-containing protein [Deltaproteobacteria bacterium]|nr:Hpt domain-containing protein [Deltaproteobacteria bacterium]